MREDAPLSPGLFYLSQLFRMGISMVDRHNAEHYIWKDRDGIECTGWHLVQAPGMSIILERMPAGTAERRHYHTAARQFFFVLRGELSIEIEGDIHELHDEQGVEIPPQKSHQVINKSEGETTFLVISSPPSHGDRVNEEERASNDLIR